MESARCCLSTISTGSWGSKAVGLHVLPPLCSPSEYKSNSLAVGAGKRNEQRGGSCWILGSYGPIETQTGTCTRQEWWHRTGGLSRMMCWEYSQNNPFGRAGPVVCKVSFGGRGCLSVGSRLFGISALKMFQWRCIFALWVCMTVKSSAQ